MTQTHRRYYSIEADSYFELGGHRGELFGKFVRDLIEERKDDSRRRWRHDRERAKQHQEISRETFPHLFDELRGFAEAARVDFDDLWLLNLEDEVAEMASERCTTVVTNNCSLIAHNEDWDDAAAESICVLRWRIRDLRVIELSYMNTIGGNAISVNSHGYVHAVNALLHKDHQIGVPKNLVARWLSETNDPERDFRRLETMTRSSGFHHTIVNSAGDLWSLETSATEQVLRRPECPFVHTNHYLTGLARFEEEENWISTQDRYRQAARLVRNSMSENDIRQLVSDRSRGRRRSILNRTTIARAIVDMRRRSALIWLLVEEQKGWVPYDLPLA